MVVSAQEERPQITPGERKVPRKKDAGPRAVGVLQLDAKGKATLLPVAILVGGKFWDAGAYKADPIPMALDTGTVYEAERTGNSLGLFTVNSALHSRYANVQNPWIGTGKWLPGGVETKTALKAENVPAGIDTSDQAPRLTRDPQKVAPPPANAPASNAPTSSTSTPQASPQTSPQTSAPSASGDEPPRLTKSTSASESAPSAGTPQAGQSQPEGGAKSPAAPGDSKPAEAKPGDAKTADRPATPESDSGANQANRPTLRRGKPVGPLPEDDVPGYSKPGAAAAALPANAGKTAEPAADQGPVQLVPAISDATGPEPKSFTFQWLKDEEGERRQQITALAKEQVRAYVDARAKANIVPKPAGAPAARHSSAAKPTGKGKDPILENAQMTAYDLWGNNQPVLVFSAEAHLPPPAGNAPTAADSDLQYSIMLVAYPDIYNNLHKIYVGVTDKYHLDLTPRLELIDALDADGDGHGELLFRETSDGGAGWVIYRASADKLWKMFDSLRPE